MRSARAVAYRALQRIDHEGAYANLVLPGLLAGSQLDARDRAFVTNLVYGTTRMRRACDFLVDRFVIKDPAARGPHPAAAGRVPARLRRGRRPRRGEHDGRPGAAARPGVRQRRAPQRRPDAAVVARRRDAAELPGLDRRPAARRARPRRCRRGPGADEHRPPVSERDDGYIQDLASTWVADLVEAQPGDLVLDLCAAPGGKATHLAGEGRFVVAADVAGGAGQVGRGQRPPASGSTNLAVVVADATAPPLRAGRFDRVLLDAPCSGLGALRRRPDARWRVQEADVDRLAGLQRDMLTAAAGLVRPGGVLVYSVCTLTAAESIDHPAPAGWTPLPRPGAPWRAYGDGGRLLPQDADTDGMTVLRYRRQP